MRRIIFIPGIIYFFILFFLSVIEISPASNIEGEIKDALTNEPLIGANVILTGTSLGGATDGAGKYTIRNVPSGSYTIRVTYIGYETIEKVIEVRENEKLEQNFNLKPVGIEGETVVVTAQASGQMEAINKQLSSDRILNAVSSARIQELPDANAAESVGRLPGVSLLRSGGEGDRVVIRGLAPQYNVITVNGVKLSSSNQNDRSTDLSMISPNMLEGIQVSKTITADMDANAIGGIVNFDLREANAGSGGIPNFSFLGQGAYNGLPNAKDKYRNYKFVGTVENRFFDNRFGVFLQGSVERRNLSSNELGANYGSSGNSPIDYLTQNITLYNIARDRMRNNGVLTLDYLLPKGKIVLSNLFSTSVTESEDRRQFYNLTSAQNNANFQNNYSKSTLNTLSNTIKYEQQAWIFNTTTTFSHSYSETKNPRDWAVNFLTRGVWNPILGNVKNLDPRDVVEAARLDPDQTLLNTISTNHSFTRERALSLSLDFDTPITLSNYISAIIKFGAKYQYQKRFNNVDVTNGEPFGLQSGQAMINQFKAVFPWFTDLGDGLRVSMYPFVDQNYDYGEFLNGEYKLVFPFDYSRMQSMMDYAYEHQFVNNSYYNNVGASITNDYSGQEDISAAYAMATINVGEFLTIIPGVRYQQLKTNYKGAQGLQGPTSPDQYPHREVSYTAYHPYWLPNLFLRYKPLDWFDVRLAYTNTLSYPDYPSLYPRINVFLTAGTLQWNGFKLVPIESKNYDVYFSFYENTIGLFTAGAFLKQIKNLIYQYTFNRSTSTGLANYYPEWTNQTPPPATSLAISTYLNNPYRIDNYGMELDWQTHFWYLPEPFSGLVMSINYTHIFSEAQYPDYFQISLFPPRAIDTFYYAPLLYQPDDIINLTIGYDYKGFSIRVSSLYSTKIFTNPNHYSHLRSSTSAYHRWDLSLKQEIPFVKNLEVFCNLNNITGAEDVSVIHAATGVPSRKQHYDYMIEAGLRTQF